MGNKFYGEGNLGSDPTLRNTDSSDTESDSVCNLWIFFDKPRPVEDGEGFEDKGGFWMNTEIWGKRGENCHSVLRKGDRVSVDGSLVQKKWKDGEDRDRSELCVKARRVNPDIIVVESTKEREAATEAQVS